MERRADTARTAARDQHLPGSREFVEGPCEGRPRVRPAAMADRRRAVARHPVADVHVAGAGRDVQERPAAEGVQGAVDVKEACLEARVVERVDAIVEPGATWSAGADVEAPAAALEEDHHALRIGSPKPKGIAAASCAGGPPARLDPLPLTGRSETPRCGQVVTDPAVEELARRPVAELGRAVRRPREDR